MNRPQGRTPDLVAGVAVVGLGLVVAIVAAGYPDLPSGRPGPGFFPMILGGCMMILGGSLIAQYLTRASPERSGKRTLRPEGVINGLLVLAAPIVFILVAPYLGSGFVLGGICFALMLRLGVQPVRALIISAIAAFVMVFLFVDLLGVRLP